jgi:hypothetical protein
MNTIPSRMRGRYLTILACLTVVACGLIAAPGRGAAYPPKSCPTISVSTTQPVADQQVVVTGSGFAAGESVTLTLHSAGSADVQLGTVTADASGHFSMSVTIPPSPSGSWQLTAVGAVAASCTASIQLGFAGEHSNVPPPGGPSSTGVDVALILAVALVMIGAGVISLLAARSRSRRSHVA